MWLSVQLQAMRLPRGLYAMEMGKCERPPIMRTNKDYNEKKAGMKPFRNSRFESFCHRSRMQDSGSQRTTPQHLLPSRGLGG